ncbi:Protein SABRE [Cryptotrichosporon argae]
MLGWQSIGLQCQAPGEGLHDKTQLLAIRQVELDAFSSWRPAGWTRDEMLFSNDPNLALTVATVRIASIDLAADIQLLEGLQRAATDSRRSRAATVPNQAKPTRPAQTPPRIRLAVELGHTCVLVADSVSDQSTAITIASDGAHFGCFSSYSDICGRRAPNAARDALREEEALQARRSSADEAVDLTLPEAMLKPQFRRSYDRPARLDDDMTTALRVDATLMVLPVSLRMTLDGPGERQQSTFDVVTVGTIFGEASGDVRGKNETDANGAEQVQLDPTSLSCNVNVGVDSGIKIRLWDKQVIAALIAMGNAHRSSPAPPPPTSSQRCVLDRLPSGVSAQLSLGQIALFIGSPDPNPHCHLRVVRGLSIRTTAALNYAFYRHTSQGLRCRHALDQPTRKKLRLTDDVTSQALAFANALDKSGGHAALLSLSAMDTVVRIVEDSTGFERAYDSAGSFVAEESRPQPAQDNDFVAWNFLRNKDAPEHGTSANNVPLLDMTTKPLVRISHVLTNFVVQKPARDAELEYMLSTRCELVSLAADEAAIWCGLLGAQAIKRICAVWKRPQPAAAPSALPRLSVNASVPTIWVNFSLPLKEQIFLSLGTIQVSQRPNETARATSEYVLLHVPSPKHVGSWEELGRIRSLEVRPSAPGERLGFDIKATSLRVRIPHAYTLSKLVLNVNMLIKTLKLLMDNLKHGEFHFFKHPVAEPPKRVPRIGIEIASLNLEAKDHPMETDMNLAWRVGLIEQETRNRLEDTFEQKLHILAGTHPDMSITDEDGPGLRGLPDLHDSPKLSDRFGVSLDEARYRLDWYMSRSWVRRIKRAKLEQRRREISALRPLQISTEIRLPIAVVPPRNSAPLFRASFRGIRMNVANPGLSRRDIIQYMSDVSAPFRNDVEFSLMVPLDFQWEMGQATVQLRDYPLPLIRIQPVGDGSQPAWSVKTLFVVAEELAGPDSSILVPCEVLPGGRGHRDAQSMVVKVAKTIMPVKTYARLAIKIASDKTTEFTWGNSYQPAIQDLMRVVESLSHPPRDPSPKIGFWDKFRLILHWRVSVDFVGPVHLHLKGSYDPYSFTGHGAGFALSWRGNTRLEIAQPNEQYETIQIKADELLIAIPDLTALKDGAAIGVDPNPAQSPATVRAEGGSEQDMIERRSTKPCARFLNGVRVGFGFKFERTCRPWSCAKCGSSENLMHRQCRLFEFKQHQDVILRSPEAIKKLEHEVGHPVDSYEGFRSDFIHFSVSCIAAPRQQQAGRDNDSTGAGLYAENHNSLHFSPKAFAHFYAWWKLFDHTMSLPIRQGKAFPESGPPSKKFGRSLGTIKYRFNLAPVYVSHFYSQVSQDLWNQGKAQYVGLKARFGHFRADAHQRAQEKVVRHEKLKRTTTVVHKPFYAADLLLDQFRVKGVAADFSETRKSLEAKAASGDDDMPQVTALAPELRQWYNFFDFIDADRKPFDRNPRVSIVDIGDCPHVFFAKRVKARQTTANDDDQASVASSAGSHIDVESSKFGHEKSHICYLNTMKGVGDMQREITEGRMRELQHLLDDMLAARTDDNDGLAQRKIIEHRLHILRRHLDYLASSERRRIDDDTFQAHDALHAAQAQNRRGETTFENTFHVHCPRIFFNNVSRNIVFKYWFSSQDRKREEYTTSHA